MTLRATTFDNLPANFRNLCAQTEVGSSYVHGQCWTFDGGRQDASGKNIEGMAVGYQVGSGIIWAISLDGLTVKLVGAKSIRRAAEDLGLGDLGPVAQPA